MGGGARPRRALLLVENLSVPFDRRVWREAVSLREAGWRVTVISPRGQDRDTARRETIDGIDVRRFRLIEAEGAFTAYVVEYGFAVLSMFWLALRVWLRRGFDVIQICNPPDLLIFAALPFKLVGVRVIFDHHDLSPELYISKNPDKRPGRVHRALLFFERLTFRLANVVMSTNESYRNIALERGGKRPEDVFVVRNGPELSRLKNAVPNPELRKGAEHLVVYVGMMGKQDGLDYLLRALMMLKRDLKRGDFHALLIGDGPEAPTLKAYTRIAGIEENVTFTGLVAQDKVFEGIATASVCVCPDPAIGLNEKSTLVKVLEYMGLGKPVVAFDLVETRASAAGAALYVTPNSEREFAEKIAWLLDRPEERERMGREGRDRILNGLAWDHQKEQMLAAYERATRSRGGES
jgi:glycosyltransferase involved in cell wall biosynthesis